MGLDLGTKQMKIESCRQMSLQAQPIPAIPELTVKIARQAFRKGNVYMQMRDVMGTFFQDDQFTGLYPIDGQPTYAPWRLALVSIMQFAENLSDRQAADAVRSRIDWKYALSLELTDEGFNFSVLSEFRQRLLEHEAGEQLLETMLEQFRQAGLLQVGGKQRTDSTHVLASVRDLNRLERVGRSLQAALDAIAEVAPEWLKEWVVPEWYRRYGQLLTEFRLPQKTLERDVLAVQIGWDGQKLLERVYQHPDTPSVVRTLVQVKTLRQMWLQQYVQIEDTLRWRTREEVPPASRSLESPFDVEARYACKRDTQWLGYKVHLTETCDDHLPHRITQVMTVNATQQDTEALAPIHQRLQQRDCLPQEHLVDKGYTSTALLFESRTQYGIDVVGPVVEKYTWQHDTGYSVDAFTVDWEHRQLVCPQGRRSAPWTMRPHLHGYQLARVHFYAVDCQSCPVKERCTKHVRRTVSLPEQPLFETIQRRKTEQHTQPFHQRYRQRAGIEGTISHGVFALGMRRSRFRGQAKTHLQFLFTACAINLTRVMNWYNQVPRKKTPMTRFGHLAA